MKNYILTLLLIILLVGCNNKTNKSIEEFTFTENSKIILESEYEGTFSKIRSGEHLVFTYYFQKEEHPDISDDEYAESIIFEINPNLSTFSYADDELMSVNSYFDKYCFCVIEGSIQISKGTIKGVKIDDQTWNVEIDVTFTDNDIDVFKTINGSFTKK